MVLAGLLMALTATVAYAEGGNHMDRIDQIKEGSTTKKEAIKVLGKPMCESMVNGCALCTFSDGTQTVTLQFDKKGVLHDKKEWKPGRQFAE
jgi:outer membrane protein assembly factor BamE (lipoprotein component of BamABCDE complex)